MSDDPLVTSLRTALETRPAPPSTLDLVTVKLRGRRRRQRRRVLTVTAGLAVVLGLAVPAAIVDVDWPWTRTRDSTAIGTSAAAAPGPDEIVRRFLSAQLVGDSARAYDDYWVPGYGARIDVTAEELQATNVAVGVPEPTTRLDGWQETVTVGVSWTTGTGPWAGSFVVVRDDRGRWRIDSLSGNFVAPVITVAAEPEEGRDAWGRTGVVGLDTGCLVLDEALLVWPTGSTWDAAAQQVVLAGGTRIGVGDRVEVWGRPLPDVQHVLGPDGAAAAARCGGVDVPAGSAAAPGTRPVLEVSR